MARKNVYGVLFPLEKALATSDVILEKFMPRHSIDSEAGCDEEKALWASQPSKSRNVCARSRCFEYHLSERDSAAPRDLDNNEAKRQQN
jgi:hypothetical protein